MRLHVQPPQPTHGQPQPTHNPRMQLLSPSRRLFAKLITQRWEQYCRCMHTVCCLIVTTVEIVQHIHEPLQKQPFFFVSLITHLVVSAHNRWAYHALTLATAGWPARASSPTCILVCTPVATLRPRSPFVHTCVHSHSHLPTCISTGGFVPRARARLASKPTSIPAPTCTLPSAPAKFLRTCHFQAGGLLPRARARLAAARRARLVG